MLGDAGFGVCSRIKEATKLSLEKLAVVSPVLREWRPGAGRNLQRLKEDWVFRITSSLFPSHRNVSVNIRVFPCVEHSHKIVFLPSRVRSKLL